VATRAELVAIPIRSLLSGQSRSKLDIPVAGPSAAMDGRRRAHMESLPRFFGHVLAACLGTGISNLMRRIAKQGD